MTSRPKPAADLGPLYADPSAPTREPEGLRAGAGAHPRARAYTRPRANPQEGAGMDLEVAGRALVAALKKVGERRDALAACVAAARAVQVVDEEIRARLVVAGLPEADVTAALTSP